MVETFGIEEGRYFIQRLAINERDLDSLSIDKMEELKEFGNACIKYNTRPGAAWDGNFYIGNPSKPRILG